MTHNSLKKHITITLMLAVVALSISNVQAAPVKVGSYIGNWNAKTSYAAGDLITLNNKTFLSLVARNLNKNPDTSPASWQLLGGVGATGLQGPIGPQGVAGAVGGGSSVPGATLEALGSDVQDNLALGPIDIQTCNSNPYIAGSIPCPESQSQCPSGTPIITKLSCISTTTDFDLIKTIFININGYDLSSQFNLSKPRPYKDTVNNIQKCTAPGYNDNGFTFGGGPSGSQGFTPWCFYKVDGSSYGRPYPFDNSQSPDIAIISSFNAGSPVISYVTTAQYNDPNNWQCFPIEIQAEAHCVVIPVKLKSVFQHFGIKVK